MPTEQLTKEEKKLVKSNCCNCKRCSDFDDECILVPDKLGCWMGLSNIDNGIKYETGIADGYCPFIHIDN